MKNIKYREMGIEWETVPFSILLLSANRKLQLFAYKWFNKLASINDFCTLTFIMFNHRIDSSKLRFRYILTLHINNLYLSYIKYRISRSSKWKTAKYLIRDWNYKINILATVVCYRAQHYTIIIVFFGCQRSYES